MGSDSCFAVFGVRFKVEHSELDSIGDRTHLAIRRAREHRLQHLCTQVGEDQHYELLIGAKLASLGPEHKLDVTITDSQFSTLLEQTRSKLKEAAFDQEPGMHFIWYMDL